MRIKIDKQRWRDFWEGVLFNLGIFVASLIVVAAVASFLLLLYLSNQ